MSKWNLIFDASRCNSCNNCVLATKDEYLFNRFEGYSDPAPQQGNLWFTLERHERGHAPQIDVTHYISACHQCADAPCITDDTSDAISQRADGIVMIDPAKAKGRRDLVEACPFGHIHWNEAENVAQKYSFDAHLLDNGWTQNRAAQVCPTEALSLAKLDDAAMRERAAREQLVPLAATAPARPRIWYRNAAALTSSFLAGTLVIRAGGTEDCAADIPVRLIASDGAVHEQRSDAFGDFKFDGLAGRGESYRLEAATPSGEPLFAANYDLDGSQWVGVIPLMPDK